MPQRITAAVLRSLKPGESVRSSTLQGFIARRHRDGRVSFEVRRQGSHPIHRVLGREDVLTLPQAEEAARKALATHTLAKATEPGKRISLDQGWELYRKHLLGKGEQRSPKTVRTYALGIKRLSTNVRKTSLRALAENPSIIKDEHARIVAKGHLPAADATGRVVSAVYKYVARRHDQTLPSMSPVVDIDLTIKDAVGGAPVLTAETAPEWWEKVQKLSDPVRRQAHLFLLLSGLRPESLCDMMWEHQVPEFTWQRNIPKPKGGRRRAFVLVMSEAMQHCIRGALVGRSEWIFPDRSRQKPLDQARLDDDARQVTGWWPQDLRRSYATFAASAGVSDDTVDRFLNHKGASPITARYIRSSGMASFLREQQEAISRHIIDAIGDPQLGAKPDEPMVEGPLNFAEMGITWPPKPR